MANSARILAIGLNEPELALLTQASAGTSVIATPYEDRIFEGPVDDVVHVVLCGAPPEEMKVAELAQSMRMHYPTQPIFYLTSARAGYQRADFQKNGFTDAFLMPNDRETFLAEIARQLALASDGAVRAFRQVQLIDLEADVKLGFDLYLHLPANQRKIRYVSSSDAITDKQVQRLQKHCVKSALVTEDQMAKFYQYTAERLKRLGSSTGLSATEAKERKERAIRELFAGIFGEGLEVDTISTGRELMNDCQQIVKAYIVDESDQKTSWFTKLMDAGAATNTPYNHAANTATFAALLSIGLGIGDPKEIALAALLHDIGLADVDPAIVAKPAAQRTPIEQYTYEQHPLRSIEMIRERKIIVSEKVLKIVEQHHERYDGTGYPSKLAAYRMIKEAQVLAIADLLDEMTMTSEGKPKMSISDALQRICKAGFDNPSVAMVDAELLTQIQSLFRKAA